MADTDLMQLYSRRILALTTSIPHQGRLEDLLLRDKVRRMTRGG